MKSNFYHSILAGVAALSLFGASLAHADVDVSKSTVVATTKQMNVPVDGKFKKFSAQLNFDPAKPTAGNANVSIDTGSYDLGADDYNKQAQGKEWFDSATYPAATFVSSAIAPAGGNQYKITGKLTIKGKSQDCRGAGHHREPGQHANLRRLTADQAFAVRCRDGRMERHVGGRRRSRHQISHRCFEEVTEHT